MIVDFYSNSVSTSGHTINILSYTVLDDDRSYGKLRS